MPESACGSGGCSPSVKNSDQFPVRLTEVPTISAADWFFGETASGPSHAGMGLVVLVGIDVAKIFAPPTSRVVDSVAPGSKIHHKQAAEGMSLGRNAINQDVYVNTISGNPPAIGR
jgi:hypothetical protein